VTRFTIRAAGRYRVTVRELGGSASAASNALRLR
jgi:hypothetical protein